MRSQPPRCVWMLLRQAPPQPFEASQLAECV
eukprot:CAMPEP_0114173818 /NCGR_PEP_ID=MMETSP0043_2-20121206/36048_1 /TAXON_ID=464988 /ORGANISM="Hemiselmis andersenii, Strain CCMP644" /LENGTH=30 /DNA_ID= /DNA_START= /DNA_END= /DNA_ORIENTATION=